MTLSSVDLPAPFGPMIATSSARKAVIETPRRTSASAVPGLEAGDFEQRAAHGAPAVPR
jgi:hypothetical protein